MKRSRNSRVKRIPSSPRRLGLVVVLVLAVVAPQLHVCLDDGAAPPAVSSRDSSTRADRGHGACPVCALRSTLGTSLPREPESVAPVSGREWLATPSVPEIRPEPPAASPDTRAPPPFA
jgi:hypothetical protein